MTEPTTTQMSDVHTTPPTASAQRTNDLFATLVAPLFTDEQQNALDDPSDAPEHSHRIVYKHSPPCPEHHKQLLDALQIGKATTAPADSQDNSADETSVFHTKLDHTHTTAGKHTLWKWLEHPLTQASDVQLRRRMCEQLVSNQDVEKHALRAKLATMESDWRSLCWCWDDSKSKTELVDNLLFTGYFESFNEMPMLVNVYHFMRVCGTPLIHCLAPIVPVLLSFGMLKWMGAGMSFRECWDMSTGVFKNALWFDSGTTNSTAGAFASVMQHGGGGGCEHPLLSGVRNVVPKLMRSLKWVWWAVFVINIVLMVYQCYRHYKLLHHVYTRTRQACTWLRHAVAMSPQYATSQPNDPTHQHIDRLIEWSTNTQLSYSLFTDTHAFLQAYLTLRTPIIREASERLLRQVGVLDALQSVDVLLNREGFCVPEVVDGPTETPHTTRDPTLQLTNAYHPILHSKQTKHSLTLDKHIVLTGSNASGKSTVLKTMLLNVLLAQSWGVVCADSMRWTPFASIRGYLHTVDDCGKESLFQAQIRRIEEFIVAAREHKHHPKQSPEATAPFALLVVDEILNSTNPIEAMLLSYQYAKTIGTELSGNTRMVMTTHYPVLTTLAETQKMFANWAMLPDYQIGHNKRCKASSAIGTVKQMTKVLTTGDHTSLEKAYKRMYKKLSKMRFKELDAVDANYVTTVEVTDTDMKKERVPVGSVAGEGGDETTKTGKTQQSMATEGV